MLLYCAVRETSARLLANASAFWAGQVKNCPGQVEFYIEHIRDTCFRASTLEISFPHCCDRWISFHRFLQPMLICHVSLYPTKCRNAFNESTRNSLPKNTRKKDITKVGNIMFHSIFLFNFITFIDTFRPDLGQNISLTGILNFLVLSSYHSQLITI